jgi:hypothetical protein
LIEKLDRGIWYARTEWIFDESVRGATDIDGIAVSLCGLRASSFGLMHKTKQKNQNK